MSLRLKLTLWYAGLLTVLIVGFAVVHYYVVKWNITNEMKEQLSVKATELAFSIESTVDTIFIRNVSMWKQLEYSSDSDFAIYVQLINESGNVLFRTINLEKTGIDIPVPDPIIKNKTAGLVTFDFLDEPFYSYLLPVKFERETVGWIQIGAFEKRITNFLQMLKDWMTFSVPFGLVMAVFIGYYLARKGLAPFDAILHITNQIDSAHLNFRVPRFEHEAIEIQQLSSTINNLLDRLSESFVKVSDFTSDASHELLTPLTAMIGNIDVTLRRKRSVEEYIDTMQKIKQDSQRMQETVKALLFLARSEPPYGFLNKQAIHAEAIIQEEIDNLAPLIYAKSLKVDYTPVESVIFANDTLFRQLIQNLLSNAIKYSHENGLIRVSLEQNSQSILIRFIDDGIGIPEISINRLFDRFYRVDESRQRQTGGIGLGLTISKRIVDLHDGKIDIISEEKIGTEVIVTLPKTSISA